MKNYINSNYYSIFIASIICFLCLQNSYAQTEEQITESQETNQRLIRKGATYIGASVGLEMQKTKLPNGESGFDLNLGGKAQYAFSDYFAFGGELAVTGFRSSNDFVSSTWLIAIGPSFGFFIPNKSSFTPYISASGGYTHVFIGSSELSKGGNFYSGSIGLIYEINHFLGVGLEYDYAKFNQPSELRSFSAGGIGLGFLFSL